MTWANVPLAELARVDAKTVQPELIPDGVPYVGLESIGRGGRIDESITAGASDLKSAKNSYDARHVLFGKLRPNLGKVARPTGAGVTSTDIYPLLPNDRIDRDYLAQFLLTPEAIAYSAGRASGVNLPRVSWTALRELRVPLPPFAEQRRIAAILDEADALDRPATDALGNLSALRQSLFASAVSEVRTRVSIADVALKITDGTHQAPGWSVTGVPFLFVSNIISGLIDYSTTKYVSRETYDRLTRHSPIEKGDVLYSAVGSYGVPAVVDSDDPFLFQRHIAHIKPRPDVVDSWYLHTALGSADFLNQAHRVARGVAQKTVTLGELSRLTIPLPSLEAQRHVAERLEAVRRAHAIVTHHRSSIRSLFASLQHRAFRGEL